MLLFLRYFFVDLAWGIIRWPLWWYTNGFIFVIKWGASTIDYYGKSLAVGVWVKNIFVPMFGQRDIQSRIISFFMRIVNIIFRSITLGIWAIIVLIAVLVYVALPPLFLTGFVYFLTI